MLPKRDVYGIDDMVKNVWNLAADFGVQGAIGLTVFQRISQKWVKWRAINGNKDRKGKKVAREEFERELKSAKKDKQVINLTEVLVQSILKSNEYLKKEILALKAQVQDLAKSRTVANKKEVDRKMKDLDKKLQRLENIEVKANEKRKKTAKKR
jgi:hypothetical protein